MAPDIATRALNEVEKAMWRLRLESHDSNIGRAQAMKNFMDWLTSDEVTKGTRIPFPNEAAAFADIYWKNKKLYADEVAKFTRQLGQQQAPGAPPVIKPE